MIARDDAGDEQKRQDPFYPPAVPTRVSCLHCGGEYESDRIEWRVEPGYDGTLRGMWRCPVEGCDGVGFGCDILPTDMNYRDERGGWVDDGYDEGEEWEDESWDDLPPAAPRGPDDDVPF